MAVKRHAANTGNPAVNAGAKISSSATAISTDELLSAFVCEFEPEFAEKFIVEGCRHITLEASAKHDQIVVGQEPNGDHQFF